MEHGRKYKLITLFFEDKVVINARYHLDTSVEDLKKELLGENMVVDEYSIYTNNRQVLKVEYIKDFNEEFEKFISSDNVVKSKEGDDVVYKTQCTQYCATFDYDKLFDYFIKEYML